MYVYNAYDLNPNKINCLNMCALDILRSITIVQKVVVLTSKLISVTFCISSLFRYPTMASSSARAQLPAWHCLVCDEVTMFLCKGCLEAPYCSREHQQQDWKMDHSIRCVRTYPRLVYPKSCHNVSRCGVWYFPYEHPDEEFL